MRPASVELSAAGIGIAHAGDFQARSFQSAIDQVIDHGLRALDRQDLIRGFGAGGIRVAFDAEAQIGIVLHQRDNFAQRDDRFGRDVGAAGQKRDAVQRRFPGFFERVEHGGRVDDGIVIGGSRGDFGERVEVRRGFDGDPQVAFVRGQRAFLVDELIGDVETEGPQSAMAALWMMSAAVVSSEHSYITARLLPSTGLVTGSPLSSSRI